MQPLRLAILAPRFWPLVGDAEWHALRLAEELLEQGHKVRVVSAQWRRAWPAEMCVGPVPLVRLRGSLKSGWSTLRWMYGVSRWLREQANSLDAVLVSGLRNEAYAALRALRESRVPVVLESLPGDLAWQRTATFGSRIARRCLRAAAYVAPNHAIADQLAAAGYARQRITVIPRGVALPPPRSPVQRDAARESLASVNSDLVTTDGTFVGLAIGRLDAEHCFGDLVRAWRIVTANRPDVRLWIVGDGPQREPLFRQICDLDLRHRVLLPGTFDFLDDLLAAADLFVQPAACDVAPLALLSALAAGLPVVAADSPAAKDTIDPGRGGLMFPAADPKAMAAHVERLICAPAEGVSIGSAARDTMRSRPKPEDEAARYVELFSQLVE